MNRLMEEDEPIVTLQTFYDPMLAEIIRTKLEANGIPCMLSDNNLGSSYPMYNQGGGGIRIKVFRRDLEQSRQILDAQDDTPPGND